MLQNIFFGLSLGAVYSLIAVGFALVFNILKFSNFSHGGVMTFTAYAGYLAYAEVFKGHLGEPALFLAVVATAAVVGALTAMLIECVGFRRLRRNQAPVIYYFISSITLGILLENIITIFASSNFYSYPVFFPQANFSIFSISFSVVDLLPCSFPVLRSVSLLVVLYRTKLGLAVRTVSFDVNTASLMGIDPDRVVMATFALSGALGGISGVFLGMNYSLYPQIGQLVVKGYANLGDRWSGQHHWRRGRRFPARHPRSGADRDGWVGAGLRPVFLSSCWSSCFCGRAACRRRVQRASCASFDLCAWFEKSKEI